MNPDDPQVARALRMGKTRRQQADLLGVSVRTVQRLVHGTVPPFRGHDADGDPTPATDKRGQQIVPGDVVRYPEQRGGAMRKEAVVVEILPPFGDGDPSRPFRLRVERTSDRRISVIRAVELVEVAR